MNNQSQKTNRVFQDIERDIRERARKRLKQGSRQYETYVDRDRAVAVTTEGVQDLRNANTMYYNRIGISRHKKLELMDPEIVNIIVQQASHQLKQGDAEAALKYLNKIFTEDDETAASLVLKGRCLIGVNQYQDAMKTVEAAKTKLKEGQVSGKILWIQADALFLLGHFEHALLNYHRALKRVSNKDRSLVEERARRSEIAVATSIGTKLEDFLDTFGPEKLALEQVHEWCQDPKYLAELLYVNEDDKNFRNAFMGKMSTDAEFLDNLLQQIQHQKSVRRAKNIKKAMAVAGDGIRFLNDRLEFWSQHD